MSTCYDTCVRMVKSSTVSVTVAVLYVDQSSEVLYRSIPGKKVIMDGK